MEDAATVYIFIRMLDNSCVTYFAIFADKQRLGNIMLQFSDKFFSGPNRVFITAWFLAARRIYTKLDGGIIGSGDAQYEYKVTDVEDDKESHDLDT